MTDNVTIGELAHAVARRGVPHSTTRCGITFRRPNHHERDEHVRPGFPTTVEADCMACIATEVAP